MSTQPRRPFAAYTNALKSISARTGAPLPSLIVSFGILHELTAIVPMAGAFYASRALGVGEAVINQIIKDTESSSTLQGNGKAEVANSVVGWGKQKVRGWVEEGDKWAARIGRRYGMLGYEKRQPGEVDDWNEVTAVPGHLAGDVANVVVAYGVAKALLPLRIGASLYFSPAFSRHLLEPFRRAIMRPFKRREP